MVDVTCARTGQLARSFGYRVVQQLRGATAGRGAGEWPESYGALALGTRSAWWALAVVIAGGALAVGCTRPADTEVATDAWRSPHLVLEVTPDRGAAPLRVRLVARIVGETQQPADSHCPSIAWVMGNGDVVIGRPADCGGQLPQHYESEYTFRVAGAYNVSARLLAVPVMPSSPRQVLVLGSTPTPVPRVAVPGPTIVLATPVKTPRPLARASVGVEVLATRAPTVSSPSAAARTGQSPGAGVATVLAATAPFVSPARQPEGTALAAGLPSGVASNLLAGTVSSQPAGTTPRPVGAGPRVAVLPASLYYVALRDGRIYRLPASGAAPEAVSPPGQAVSAYDVGASGALAYISRGELWLALPVGEPFRVAHRASHPVWSRDGRELAYAAAGVWRYRVADGRREQLAKDGLPLAWSRGGTTLVVRRADGTLQAIETASSRDLVIPLAGVEQVGWFPDREVLWASGRGLWLVGLGAQVQLVALVEDAATRSVFLRPDGRLLALMSASDGWQPVTFDLHAPVLAATPLGPALPDAITEGFRWSPDGRHGASVGPAGIQLVDPSTRTWLPLLEVPAALPCWRLDSGEGTS